MATGWSVYAEITYHVSSASSDLRHSAEVQRMLRDYFRPTGEVFQAARSHRVAVRDVVNESSWETAQELFLQKLKEARRQSKLAVRLDVVLLHVGPEGYKAVPDLGGVAEVANYLKVTPQRVRQLMGRHDFPEPVERLRMGPVFLLGEIAEFEQRWNRSPGRRVPVPSGVTDLASALE